MNKPLTVYQIIQTLKDFWQNQGCVVHESYDIPMGAGTFHPATFFSVLSHAKQSVAFAQMCRRPADARYGENPNRLGKYFQFQVVLNPSPIDCEQKYLQSLETLGLETTHHDIRFLEDNWESLTLGASGLGYEVWCDGMEISQYTYFQQFAGSILGIKNNKKNKQAQFSVPLEITYGIERLAMYLQDVTSIFDLQYTDTLTYGQMYTSSEYQWSMAAFQDLPSKRLLQDFENAEATCYELLEKSLYIPAYDYALISSNTFNLLDASGFISQIDRPNFIKKIRNLIKQCAQCYLNESKE